MQAIRNKDTKIEITLGKALWKKGLRYRKNNKKVVGKPDFTFAKYKIAVFCDSEYFHGKDWELTKNRIKTNQEFWYKKIEGNIKRDQEVNRLLEEGGWLVLRFWGNDIKKNIDLCIYQIEQAIREKQNS